MKNRARLDLGFSLEAPRLPYPTIQIRFHRCEDRLERLEILGRMPHRDCFGHASPVVTLTVYAHLFHKTDAAAASAIEAAMRTGKEQ